jgi:hypothetical protein
MISGVRTALYRPVCTKTKLRTRDSIHHAQFIKANETLRQT